MSTTVIGGETVEVTGTPGRLFIGVDLGFLGPQGASIMSSYDAMALIRLLEQEVPKAFPNIKLTVSEG